MSRVYALCLVGAVLLVQAAWGQTGSDPGDQVAILEEAGQAPTVPSMTSSEGDIVTLVSGKQLSGVQVLRETPVYIEIEVLEGLEPLRIPRKQVQEIVYDDIDPIARRRNRLFATEPSPEVILGEELSAGFHRKLTAPLSDTPIEIEDQGFVMTLNYLAELAGVNIEVTEEAKTLPRDLRIRSFSIPAKTTLFSFFLSDFPKAFPALKVAYEFDKVIVSLRETQEESAPPTVPES